MCQIKIICDDNELKNSLEKYFQYVLGYEIVNDENVPHLFVFNLYNNNFKKTLGKLISNSDSTQNILPVLILNPYNTLAEAQELTGNYNIHALTEIFFDHYVHLTIPEELSKLKGFYEKPSVLPNVFADFKTKAQTISKFFGDNFNENNLPEYIPALAKNEDSDEKYLKLFSKLGKWIYKGTRKHNIYQASHSEQEDENQGKKEISYWFCQLILFYLFRARENNKPMRILWLENNPRGEILSKLYQKDNSPLSLQKLMGKMVEWFNLEIDFLATGFQEAHANLVKYRELKERKGTKDKLGEFGAITRITKNRSSENKITLKPDELDRYSFILVDIYLKAAVDGIDFVEAFSSTYPKNPVFVLSICDDFETIRKVIKGGADFYILKKHFLAFPFAYYQYIRDVGPILDFIHSTTLKESLLGNLRYWNFKRRYLWFGDKCYHMVNHSFQHCSDDWRFANSFLYPLLKKKKLQGPDDLLYAFCMAVWLHDIGHKGNEKYGEPYQIRENHGYISGELILKNPALYGIEDNDDYYKSLDFGNKEMGSAVEVLYERVKKRKSLSITEMIALIAIYHKSNCPVDEEDYLRLISKGKHIPDEYYINSRKERENIITLKRIADTLNDQEKGNLLIKLQMLFRFIDAIDIRKSRVGDASQRALTMDVIKDDKSNLLRKLKNEAKQISQKQEMNELLWTKVFVKDIIDRIERGEKASLDELKEYITNAADYENYMMLINFVSFIALQPTHFELHSSIEDIEIQYKGRFIITIKLNKTFEELKKIKVQEMGRDDETLMDRIVGIEGNKSSYFYRELEAGSKYLLALFGELPKIYVEPREEGENNQKQEAIYIN